MTIPTENTMLPTTALPVRSPIIFVLSAMLFASLACSVTLRAGHADVPIAATAESVEPVAVGEAAPRFVVREVDGTPVHFEPADLDRPVILITFRGGWCPYCNLHLSELRHVIPEIARMGVDVLFLSGDRPALLYASLDEATRSEIDGQGYRILSDADVSAAMALGIAFRASDATIARRREKGQDIAGSSMDRHSVLPVPAVFAIDTDGIVTFAYANADYSVRLPADELLDVARDMIDG